VARWCVSSVAESWLRFYCDTGLVPAAFFGAFVWNDCAPAQLCVV